MRLGKWIVLWIFTPLAWARVGTNITDPDLLDARFSGVVTVYSQGVAYGTATTFNSPEIEAELDYNTPNFYLGVDAFNIDWLQDSFPVTYLSGGGLDLEFSAGFKRKWSSFLKNEYGVTYYVYPGVPRQLPMVPPLPLLQIPSANSFLIYDTLTYRWFYFSLLVNPIEQYFGVLEARGSGSVELGAYFPVGRWLHLWPRLVLHTSWNWQYNLGVDPRNATFNSNYAPGAPYNYTPTNAELYNYGSYLFGLSYDLPHDFNVGCNYTFTYGANVLVYGSQKQCVTPGFCGPNTIDTAAPFFSLYLQKKF